MDSATVEHDFEEILKALASDKRLEILRYLGGHIASVNEIAEYLDIPPSTVTMHINLLEKAGLIRTELKPASRGLKKLCIRVYDQIAIRLPSGEHRTDNILDIAMPIGAYVDANVSPTCGLASEARIIGHLDDPSTFYDPDRVQAQLLWFKHGYVEYRFPNRIPPHSTVESIQISFEVGSEAPLHNDDWPSDITLWINGVELGTWTCPGDFGGERGALTPDWWEEWNSQYGLLKVWKVSHDGSYVDGMRISGVTVGQLDLSQASFISMRVGVREDAHNVGGINIFGRAFGNYPQDIHLRVRYQMNANGTPSTVP
ncbi:MAG: helix-turn-helix domain-containing protein [Anaerolineae bacterium]|nr:helix-turn-helix domain-containing protein [Anaerolineae bacterium]